MRRCVTFISIANDLTQFDGDFCEGKMLAMLEIVGFSNLI